MVNIALAVAVIGLLRGKKMRVASS
jgi:hypothetical protein